MMIMIQYHYRAHFSYTPDDDLYIPCHELGISFQVIHLHHHHHHHPLHCKHHWHRLSTIIIIIIITLEKLITSLINCWRGFPCLSQFFTWANLSTTSLKKTSPPPLSKNLSTTSFKKTSPPLTFFFICAYQPPPPYYLYDKIVINLSLGASLLLWNLDFPLSSRFQWDFTLSLAVTTIPVPSGSIFNQIWTVRNFPPQNPQSFLFFFVFIIILFNITFNTIFIIKFI